MLEPWAEISERLRRIGNALGSAADEPEPQ